MSTKSPIISRSMKKAKTLSTKQLHRWRLDCISCTKHASLNIKKTWFPAIPTYSLILGDYVGVSDNDLQLICWDIRMIANPVSLTKTKQQGLKWKANENASCQAFGRHHRVLAKFSWQQLSDNALPTLRIIQFDSHAKFISRWIR